MQELRASGSMEGAEQTWVRLRLNARLWKRIVTYGLSLPERQLQLNKIAFPDANAAEVDAALRAGNNLNRLYELACGRASIARDSAGHYKIGTKGLKIVKHMTVVRWRNPEHSGFLLRLSHWRSRDSNPSTQRALVIPEPFTNLSLDQTKYRSTERNSRNNYRLDRRRF